MPADALQSAACFTTSEFMTFEFAANLWSTVEASPTPFFLQPVIYRSEWRPDAFGGICRVGAGVLTAVRLKESQQAGGRRRRDGWLSQPCWQPAPWLKGNILLHARQPFADWFFLRWRVHEQYEIKTFAAVIWISYVFQLSNNLLGWSRFLLNWSSQIEKCETEELKWHFCVC